MKTKSDEARRPPAATSPPRPEARRPGAGASPVPDANEGLRALIAEEEQAEAEAKAPEPKAKAKGNRKP